MKIAEFLVQLDQLLKTKPQAKKEETAKILLDKYQSTLTSEEFKSLQHCLKAFKIPFEGDNDIQLMPAPYLPQNPPETFRECFNNDLYQQAHALSAFAHLFEKIGIPEDHATKMAVIFKDTNAMMNYLKQAAQSALNIEKVKNTTVNNVFHNAFLFALPNFQAPELKGKCDFSLWKVMANKQDNMSRKDFRELLPFAFELQQLVEKNLEESKRANVKPDAAKIKDQSEKLETLIKEYNNLEHNKTTLTDEQEERYEDLALIVSEELRGLAKLCTGKKFEDLTLLELKAFYEEHKYNSNASYKIFIDNGIPAEYFAVFRSLVRVDDDEKIPNVKINGAEINMPGYYLMKVPVMDEKHAARIACMGKLTNCCQSISGEAGQPCAIHGLTSPYGGFYVVCKGDVNAPQASDELLGGAWTWRSKKGAIVYDSIEIADNNASRLVKALFDCLSLELVDKNYTHKVACGENSGISSKFGLACDFDTEKFVDYKGYCDSKSQRIILDDLNPKLLKKALFNVKWQPEAVNRMIEKGVKLDEESLNLAIFHRRADVAVKMLFKGVKWNKECLRLAILLEMYDVVDIICDKDAKQNKEGYHFKRLPTLAYNMIMGCINADKVDSELLNQIPHVALRLIEMGVPVYEESLFDLIKNKQSEHALRLIESDAKGLKIDKKYYDESLLMLSIGNDLKRVAIKLIEKGVSTEGILGMVISHGYDDDNISKIIEKGVNKKDAKEGLRMAIKNKNKSIAIRIIEKIQDFDENIASEFLPEAISCGLSEVAFKILEMKDVKRLDMEWALQSALVKGSMIIVVKLLEKELNIDWFTIKKLKSLNISEINQILAERPCYNKPAPAIKKSVFVLDDSQDLKEEQQKANIEKINMDEDFIPRKRPFNWTRFNDDFSDDSDQSDDSENDYKENNPPKGPR